MHESPVENDIVEESPYFSLTAALWGLGFIFFILSLFLPAFIMPQEDVMGYWAFALGWLGFVAFQFAWYATPLAVMAVWYSSRRPQLALLVSVVAILLASQSFIFKQIPFEEGGEILDLGMGFYLWYMGFILVAGGNLVRLVQWGRQIEIINEEDDDDMAVPAPNAGYLLKNFRRTAKVERKYIVEAKKPPPLPPLGAPAANSPPPLPNKVVGGH